MNKNVREAPGPTNGGGGLISRRHPGAARAGMARPEEKSAYGSEFSVYAHGHLGTSPPISPRSYNRLGAGDFAWRCEDRTAALREHSAPWVDDVRNMLEDVTRKQVRLDETRRIADEKAAVLLRMFDDLREMANDTPREDLAMPPNMLTYSLHKAIADSPRAVAARTIREAPGPLEGHLAIHTRPKYARPPRVIGVTPAGAAGAAGAPTATIAATPAPHSPRSPRDGRAAAAAAIPSTRASRMAARSWTGPAWAGAGGSAPLHRTPPQAPSQAPSAAAPLHRPAPQAPSTAAPLHRPAPQQVDARGGCGGAGDSCGDGASAAASGHVVSALEGSGSGASAELGFALPASLERLVAQLHAADAAFLERLEERAVLEHMLARDTKLTELVRKGNNTDRREATLVATALKEAIARAHENLSSERRAALALHEASKRYQRAREEHVARLQERAERHQYGEWLSARLRTKPHLSAGASAALASPCTSSSSSSSTSVLSDPAQVAGEGATTGTLADLEALADDPALQTSRAYRSWYEVARRLQLPLDRLIALALERCEQLRWRDEAEARVHEARTRRAQLDARRSMSEQNRSDDEATQLGADEASQTERPVTNSTKPESENLLAAEGLVGFTVDPELVHASVKLAANAMEAMLRECEAASAAKPLAVGPTGRHALAMPATLRVGELRGTSDGSGPRPAPPLGTPSPRRVQTMGNVVAARRGSSTPTAAPPMRRRPTIGISLRNESPGQAGKGIASAVASAEEAPSVLLTVGTWTAYNTAPADGDEGEEGSLRSNFKLNEEHRVEEKREAERRASLPKRPPPRPQPSYITKQTAASLAAAAERAVEAGSLEYQELKAAIRAGPQHRAPPRRPPHTAR